MPSWEREELQADKISTCLYRVPCLRTSLSYPTSHRTASLWLSCTMENKATAINMDKYLKDYTSKYASFTQVAEHLEDICRTELDTAAIKGIVMSRAKQPQRYAIKLQKMLSESGRTDFQSMNAIENEIVDIIGIRIALYFPTLVKETISTLQGLFAGASPDIDVKELLDSKPMGWQDLIKHFTNDQLFMAMHSPTALDSDPEKYELQFGEYRAVHLRFEMQTDDLGSQLQQALGDRRLKVEIQIQSLLLNAWSEVSHDELYKPLGGQIPSREKHLLDLLNGIGKMGEKVLIEYRKYLDQRKKQNSTSTEFASAFELAEFIRANVGFATTGQKPLVLGDVQSFQHLLLFVGKNDQTSLQPELTAWKEAKQADGILTNNLIGQILTQNGMTEQTFALQRPFLLEKQNEVFKDILEAGKTVPMLGLVTQTVKKAVQTPGLVNNNYEILATIADLTIRPFLQARPQGSSATYAIAYKNLRKQRKLYLDSQPVMPRMPYAVDRAKLSDSAICKDISKLVGEISSQVGEEPLLQYHLRLARIRAWKMYEKMDLKTAFV